VTTEQSGSGDPDGPAGAAQPAVADAAHGAEQRPPAAGSAAPPGGGTGPPQWWKRWRWGWRLPVIGGLYAVLVLILLIWGLVVAHESDAAPEPGPARPAAAGPAGTPTTSPASGPAPAATSPVAAPATGSPATATSSSVTGTDDTLGIGQAEPCRPGAVPPATATSATLAPLGTPVQSVALGHHLETQVREFEFGLTDPSGLLRDATCLPVHVNPFLRTGTGDSAELDRRHIDAAVSVSGGEVRLTLTLRRTDLDFAPPGSYTGTVSIIDPRLERVDIPLAVTLAYPIWQLPLVALLLVLPAAVLNLWLLKGSFHAGDRQVTVQEFDDYAFSRNGVLAIGAGVAAAVLVFSTTYLSEATWGTSFVDVLSLVGAAFAAFTAAATPVTAAGTDLGDSLTRSDTGGGGTR
jgi:hypothetical protein